MHPHLEAAEQRLGIDLSHLRGAAEVTERKRAQATEKIKSHLGQDADLNRGLDIVAFGSMARDEMTSHSDFDYLVVAHDVVDPALGRKYREAAELARMEISAAPPGYSGLFGKVVAGSSLIDQIGLETDTNLGLTRRLLMLQESRSLLHENRRQLLVGSILTRYLHDYPDDRPRVPRFLVNDILRYWRTVAVDYQAKRWDELDLRDLGLPSGQSPSRLKWGLRYLKLRSSRKLAAAGTLLSALTPVIKGEPLTALNLREQFDMPALARLAQIHEASPGTSAHEPLRRLLCAADELHASMADVKLQEEAGEVADPDEADPDSAFGRYRERTRELQRAIEGVFFSDVPTAYDQCPTLADLSRKYLSF